MALFLVVPVVLAFQGQVIIGIGKANPDSAKLRAARVEAVMEEVRDDTTNRRRVPRHIDVTPQHIATAFRDPAAKLLLDRARIARLQQDTSLVSYDAKTYERVSVGLGVKLLGRERLAFRHEDAARVKWSRKNGAFVEMTGSRTVVPIARDGDNDANANMTDVSVVPYYPGRDNLWVGSGLARAEVDDRELVHPIAKGAEAYYTYETGDSVKMTLPDGQTITLRELRIAAREPKWNVTVGSFWFDVRSAQLVRAVYRLSTPMDIWAVAQEESARERTDTLANGKLARPNRRNQDDGPPGWAKAFMTPMKADISGITVEYGLYNQRFWLPRAQAVEGFAQISFMRVPVTFEQRFTYESVNGLDSVPPMPPPERNRVTALRDSLRAAGVDSVKRDSLVRQARRERAKEIVAERERQCATTGVRTTYRTRANGTLPIALQVPCDSAKLANSPDLPPSIYDANEELFGTGERDALMKALTFGLQPGWGPQLPVLEYGLAQTRYNRVEGLSTGIVATSALGKGYTASIGARASYADRQLNGEAALSRSNGRTTVRGAVYRRLQASDDWGNPLSFGASLASLLYARDEGAYYRAWGAELTGTPLTAGSVEWRLFGEQQWGDSVHSRWTLFGGGNDPRFIRNPVATRVTELGGALRMRPQWGLDPNGFRLMTDFRVEAAGGDSTYGRALFDLTSTKSVGPIAAALTLSGGAAVGALPPQRRFYLGGLQSVRGQTALTASGDAYWLVRGELGTRNTGARRVVFGDLGWTGSRQDWNRPGRPLAGVGTGMSFLDGLIRVDLARGLWPATQWRLDLHLDAKF
jgi:hypothetical protein